LVDWKNVGVPIVVTLITLIGGFVISSLVSVLFKPDISIELIPHKENIYKVTIDLENKGSAAAKNLKLTMESPHNITSMHIFSTENYTKRYTNSSPILEVNIPRFVQGAGSMVRIDASIDSHSKITKNDRYIVYSTYDQGSKMVAEYILPAPPKETSLTQDYNNFITTWISPITTWISPFAGIIAVISAIVGIATGLLQSLLRRRRNK
jgi:hypothetical protein